MNLLGLFAFVVGALSLLHLLLIPRTRRSYALAIGSEKIALGRRLAGLELLRTVAALALVSILFAFALTAWISLAGGSSASDVARSLERVRAWREGMDQFSSWYGIAATLLISFGLWRLVAARAGEHTHSALKTAIDLELARVRAERDAGRWEELPPTDDMAKIEERFGELQGVLTEITGRLAAGQTVTDRGTDLYELKGSVESELDQLRVEHASEDERRRLQINWHPPELDAPPPETLRERIQTFFFSVGMLRSIRGTGRLLFAAGVLLLVPSLMAITSDPLASRAGAQEAKLENLYLTLRQEEAKRAWDEAAVRGVPVQALGADDDAALDRIASAYELGTAQALARVALLPAMPVPRDVGVYRARQAVLQEFARVAPAQAAAVRLETAAGRVGPLHDDLVALSHVDGPDRPRTPEGRAFRERLREQVSRQSSDQWNRFKQAASASAASFQRAATTADIEGALLSRLVGSSPAGDVLDARVRSAVGADALTSQARSRAFEIRSNEFMATLARSGRLDAAVDAVARPPAGQMPYTAGELRTIKSVAEHSPRVDSFARHIQAAPPSLVRDRVKGVDLAAARASGENLVKMNYGGGRAPEALHHFDDLFPHHAPAGGAPRAPAATGNFSHSRNFAALRGSRRIGGVLIGREPEAGSAQFKNLAWTMQQDRVLLRLTRVDGKLVEVGPFRNRVANQSLAYAADGRPVTVTMTTADPLAELQIQLHPALVDTGLGCRAIEIDRLVDVVTGSNPEIRRIRDETNLLANGQRELYVMAWAHAVQGAPGSAWVRSRHPEIAEPIAKRASNELKGFTDANRRSMSAALRQPQALQDPALGVLPAKPEYFSPLIVRTVQACAQRSGGDLKRFEECSTAQAASTAPADFDKHPAWDAPPAEFQEWSGVREQPYKVDPELGHLRVPPGASPSWPLEFMVQLAFSTAPNGASKKVKWYEDDAIENQADDRPWQFAALSKPLQAAVDSALARDPKWADVMTGLRDFTLAQRVFRNAFSGHLGAAFPVQSLAQLATELRTTPIPPLRTPRWNVRTGSLEMRLLATLSRLPSDALGDAAGKAAACVARFGSVPPPQLAKVPVDAWDAACRFETNPGAAAKAGPAVRLSVQTSEARRIRSALKVQDDDDLRASQQGCGPL
jgi:hypothetical protein